MLTLKSFNFDQETEMNEVLQKGRLAAGSHVFVSDGKIIIPIEDGEPMNVAQKIVAKKEQKNVVLEQMVILRHSQNVLDFLIENAKPRVDEARADLAEAQKATGKGKFETIKRAEQKLKAAENAVTDLENQQRMNAMELARLQINIEFFDKDIAELSK